MSISQIQSTTDIVHQRRFLLCAVLELLEKHHLEYCLLHDYQTSPAKGSSDIDLVISAGNSALLDLLQQHQQCLGVEIVQYFRDDAQYIVLAATGTGGSAVLLPLHFCRDYHVAGRLLYHGSELLGRRRRVGRFWTLPAGMEFTCLLAKRLAKGGLRQDDLHHLRVLRESDRNQTWEELTRVFVPPEALKIIERVCNGSAESWTAREIARWRRMLMARLHRAQGQSVSQFVCRIRRLLSPPGLHVVFLGPDGVGKTTLIGRVEEDLAPAFTGVRYRTFAPMLLRHRIVHGKGPKPHELKQRSFIAAIAKAIYWLIYYSLGYLFTGYRDKVAGRLAVNHRYFMDAIVDPRRYRYRGPLWLLKACWRVVPKPDLTIFLDAPVEVIQSRKSEVPSAETARQSAAYRDLARRTRNALLVDTGPELEEVLAQVEWAILRALGRRTSRRIGAGGR